MSGFLCSAGGFRLKTERSDNEEDLPRWQNTEQREGQRAWDWQGQGANREA